MSARVGLLLAALLCAALPAQAQWKWRDAGGRVTASDLPPPREIPDKDILQRPEPARRSQSPAAAASVAASAPAPLLAASRPAVDPDLEARRRAAEAEQKAKAKVEEEARAQQRADNCRRARGALTALQSGQRIARTNERGEREVLDDAGRADEIRRAQSVITNDCRL